MPLTVQSSVRELVEVGADLEREFLMLTAEYKALYDAGVLNPTLDRAYFLAARAIYELEAEFYSIVASALAQAIIGPTASAAPHVIRAAMPYPRVMPPIRRFDPDAYERTFAELEGLGERPRNALQAPAILFLVVAVTIVAVIGGYYIVDLATARADKIIGDYTVARSRVQQYRELLRHTRELAQGCLETTDTMAEREACLRQAGALSPTPRDANLDVDWTELEERPFNWSLLLGSLALVGAVVAVGVGLSRRAAAPSPRTNRPPRLRQRKSVDQMLREAERGTRGLGRPVRVNDLDGSKSTYFLEID